MSENSLKSTWNDIRNLFYFCNAIYFWIFKKRINNEKTIVQKFWVSNIFLKKFFFQGWEAWNWQFFIFFNKCTNQLLNGSLYKQLDFNRWFNDI